MLKFLSSFYCFVSLINCYFLAAEDATYVRLDAPGQVEVAAPVEGHGIVTNNMLYVNMYAQEALTLETFAELAKKSFDQELPYCLATIYDNNRTFFFDGRELRALSEYNDKRRIALTNPVTGRRISHDRLSWYAMDPLEEDSTNPQAHVFRYLMNGQDLQRCEDAYSRLDFNVITLLGDREAILRGDSWSELANQYSQASHDVFKNLPASVLKKRERKLLIQDTQKNPELSGKLMSACKLREMYLQKNKLQKAYFWQNYAYFINQTAAEEKSLVGTLQELYSVLGQMGLQHACLCPETQAQLTQKYSGSSCLM